MIRVLNCDEVARRLKACEVIGTAEALPDNASARGYRGAIIFGDPATAAWRPGLYSDRVTGTVGCRAPEVEPKLPDACQDAGIDCDQTTVIGCPGSNADWASDDGQRLDTDDTGKSPSKLPEECK